MNRPEILSDEHIAAAESLARCSLEILHYRREVDGDEEWAKYVGREWSAHLIMSGTGVSYIGRVVVQALMPSVEEIKKDYNLMLEFVKGMQDEAFDRSLLKELKATE